MFTIFDVIFPMDVWGSMDVGVEIGRDTSELSRDHSEYRECTAEPMKQRGEGKYK